MKKLLTMIVLLSVSLVSNAQLARLITGAMTSKTADFGDISITFAYTTNLYDPELKTLTTGVMQKEWKQGASLVGLTMTKKDGIGLIKLDGKVFIDGEEIEFMGFGSYVKVYANDDFKAKKIKLVSSNGKSFEYSVHPVSGAKLISLNGEKQPEVINLEQDLKVELDVASVSPKSRLMLGMIVGVPGGKDFSGFLMAKPQQLLNVPKEALTTKQISGGGISGKTNVIDYKSDNCFRVETYEEEILQNTPFAAARFLGQHWETLPLKVKGKDVGVNYLKAAGKTGKDRGKLEFFAQKPSNFYAPAFTNLKNIGIASLNVSGVLYKQSTTKSENTVGNVRYTTITTTTWQFPQLPDAAWNSFLEQAYTDVNSMFKRKFGCETADIQQICNHTEYKNFSEIKDENTEVKISKSYKNSKRLLATTIKDVIDMSSTTFAKDLPQIKLMDDLGLDAIILMSIDLRVNDDGKKKIVLDPVLTIKVIGNQVGYGLGAPPLIFEGTVIGVGAPFKKSELNDPNIISKVAQWPNLLAGLEMALDKIQQQEIEQKYAETWQLFLGK